MNTKQFKRIEELFFELQPLAAEERDVALKSRCPDDADVRAEVEKLLGQDGSAADELSRLGREFGKEPSIEVTRQFIGQRVGCYEILDVIGHGGMGVIYRARDVRLGRAAALKAILPVRRTRMVRASSAFAARRASWPASPTRTSRRSTAWRNRTTRCSSRWS